jgi:hypothetical protein
MLDETLQCSLVEVLYNILIDYATPMQLLRLKTVSNESYSKVQIRKHLSDTSAIKNGLKWGDALSVLLCNFALEYVFRKVQANQGQ